MPGAFLPAPNDPEDTHSETYCAKTESSNPAEKCAPLTDRLLVRTDDTEVKYGFADGLPGHSVKHDKISRRQKDPAERQKYHKRAGVA